MRMLLRAIVLLPLSVLALSLFAVAIAVEALRDAQVKTSVQI